MLVLYARLKANPNRLSTPSRLHKAEIEVGLYLRIKFIFKVCLLLYYEGWKLKCIKCLGNIRKFNFVEDVPQNKKTEGVWEICFKIH